MLSIGKASVFVAFVFVASAFATPAAAQVSSDVSFGLGTGYRISQPREMIAVAFGGGYTMHLNDELAVGLGISRASESASASEYGVSASADVSAWSFGGTVSRYFAPRGSVTRPLVWGSVALARYSGSIEVGFSSVSASSTGFGFGGGAGVDVGPDSGFLRLLGGLGGSSVSGATSYSIQFSASAGFRF